MLDWNVSVRMTVDEGPYKHTMEIFQDERQRFSSNVSDFVGDIIPIVLPGGFRSLLDDPSEGIGDTSNNGIASLSGSVRDANLERD